jgi:ubiquinone/menaquinone biosynthesis C-methylase UbiE
MLSKTPRRDDLHASVIDRFRNIAESPAKEKKFPVGPESAKKLGYDHDEFVLGQIEELPLPDASVHLVISNAVFNHCPDKPRVLHEVVRVLKPAGRLQMADILLEPHVTSEEVATKGSWSD